MAYSLKNGKETLTFEVPPQWDVISVAEPQKMEAIPISQIPEVVKEDLQNPIGCSGIQTKINSDSKIVIAVDDISRHTPAHYLVEPLVDLLYELGVKPENIKIIFALGVTEILRKRKPKKNSVNE